ncbi:MAG: AI-2E family transporter [Eubacteriales bacterium]|nr:AI-2E family transporter [Christensenellaceae bacterium]MEA5066937.1 AI-2E family transporter [Eubacteriales bacterium]
MRLDRKTVKTLMGLISFAVVLAAAVHNLPAIRDGAFRLIGVLSPLLYGLALAFVLNIPMSALERRVLWPRGKHAPGLMKALKRPLAMLLAVLIALAVVITLSSIVLPRLIGAITRIFTQLPGWVEMAKRRLQRFESDMPALVGWVDAFKFDWAGMQADVVNFLKRGLGPTLGSVASVASSVFGTATSGMIAFIFALSVLAIKEQLAEQVKKTLRAFVKPALAERTLEICGIAGRVFTGFVTGQLTEALILWGLCFLGMMIFRFPDAFFISTLVGAASIVPIFGALVSATIGALLIAAADGLGRGLAFALFFVILQQLEGNLIYPRVMGNRVGLPVIGVLAAITVGGGLMGVLGMLLSIPIFAVGYALLREAVRLRTEELAAQAAKVQVKGVEAQ